MRTVFTLFASYVQLIHLHKKEYRMKQNMGSIDRALRVLIAVVIGVLYFTDQITGLAAIILGILAVIFILTSMVGFCPLYLPFKLSTVKKKDA